jgi:hypothetical protein
MAGTRLWSNPVDGVCRQQGRCGARAAVVMHRWTARTARGRARWLLVVVLLLTEWALSG